MPWQTIDGDAVAIDSSAGGVGVLLRSNLEDTLEARPVTAGTLASVVGGEAVLPFSSSASDAWSVVACRWLPPLPGRTDVTARVVYRAALAGATTGDDAAELRLAVPGGVNGAAVTALVTGATGEELELELDASSLPHGAPLLLELQARSVRGGAIATLDVHHSDDDRILGSDYSATPGTGALHAEIVVDDAELGTTAYHCTTTEAAPASAAWDYTHTVFPAPARPRARWPYNGDKAMTATLHAVGSVAVLGLEVRHACDGTRAPSPALPPVGVVASGQSARGAGLELLEECARGLYRHRGETLAGGAIDGDYCRGARVPGGGVATTIAAGSLWRREETAEIVAVVALAGRADVATNATITLTASSATTGGPVQASRTIRIEAGRLEAASDPVRGSRLAAAIADTLDTRSSRDTLNPGEIGTLPRAAVRVDASGWSVGELIGATVSVETDASAIAPLVHIVEGIAWQ